MIAKCCDWSIFVTGFAAFLLADSKYAQLVKCKSTMEGFVSAHSPITDLARNSVELSISLKLQILEKLAERKSLSRNTMLFLEKTIRM